MLISSPVILIVGERIIQFFYLEKQSLKKITWNGILLDSFFQERACFHGSTSHFKMNATCQEARSLVPVGP